MSMNRSARVPGVPTLPKGEQIAAYGTYLEAQKAVDHLSDKEFPVQHVTIVGTDLRMVERVTGRLTYSRVALAGLASGAWFGLFVGLVLSIFSSPGVGAGTIVPAVAIGAAFGILFSVISYAFTGGKRDFTSASQIVAGSYAVLCAAEHAGKARTLLTELGGGRPWPPAQPPSQPGPQVPPAQPPTQPGPQVPPAQPPSQPGPQVPPTQPPSPPTQPPSPES
ncbi:general stress protein [Cellulomonas carbonis]|uniref:General stress protein 17M-like domain-containing protein n=1 Tax=Cellulomonas carbonis T26 TaxID=947969 RepID=A0A0A0BPT0_9CELL|nr:general stress protein [Cellulomonas carbonis]KGM09951.1 hypothetical protein N868_17480 [Cellulomonas carbonis T26]